MAPATLYDDPYVRLTEEAVYIKTYFFPLGLSKCIPYEDIVEFKVVPMSEMGYTEVKTWGMALSSVWWPLDWGRYYREHVLLFRTKSWVRAAVTPPHVDEIVRIIHERLRLVDEGAPVSVQGSALSQREMIEVSSEKL